MYEMGEIVYLDFATLCAVILSNYHLLVRQKQIHEQGCKCCWKLLWLQGGSRKFSGIEGCTLYFALSEPLSTAPEPFRQYFPEADLQLQTLIFSFIKFMLVTVKSEVEVCSMFLCYFGMINTNLDIHHWKFLIESGGTWFQIMPLYLPENGIQCQWQENEFPRNQSYQQNQQLVTQMCYKIYFRSPRRVGTHWENCV